VLLASDDETRWLLDVDLLMQVLPFKNADLTSIWCTFHPSCAVRAMSKRTESSRIIGAKTSS
jgi:hypothetical protein